jgi:hypothetical protein
MFQELQIFAFVLYYYYLRLAHKFNVHKPRAQPYKDNTINNLNANVHLYKILIPGSRSTNIITVRNTWLTALGNDGVDCDSHKLIGIKKV